MLALPLAILGCAAGRHHAAPTPARTAAAPARAACVIPDRPAYPDTLQALAAAPGLIGRYALLERGRDARDAYERRVSIAKRACR